MGYLVSQQLVAAGERVIDVPAMMASRVRVLGSGKSQKSDPNDARSVAIAALCHSGLTMVRADHHAQVLGLLAKRHRAPDSGLKGASELKTGVQRDGEKLQALSVGET